jgi:NTE family protein
METAEKNSGGAPMGIRWWDATRNWMAASASRRNEPKIGLAFGGGFARGMAHIGVLRAFERHNVPIHAVAGVSAGAMLAAAVAAGATSYDIEAIALSMRLKDVARWTLSRLGFAASDRMIKFLPRLLKVNRFEEMKIPLAIVATDLNSGKPVVFSGKGDVAFAIRASCSYPGLFLPIRDGKRCLVDGFVSMEVPALPLLRLGATRVVSVSIPAPLDCADFRNMFAVVNRCFQLLSARTEQEWRSYSDVVISPAVTDLAWDSFSSARILIDRGEQAALSAMPAIKKWLGTRETPKALPAGVLRPAG